MRINELDSVCSPDKQDRIHEFCDWCCERLGINTPQLTLKPHNDTSALGYTNMDDGSVTVVVGDRHQMDIMRTLAHELVHCKQMESYEPDGATGSDDENEANAMAGVLMREWGQQNPDLYTEGFNVKEGADLGNDIHKISRAKTKKYVNTDATPEGMSAQDRLDRRAAKHGIGTPDKEKFYADMKKKFQSAMDDKGKFPGAKDVEDPHGHKKAKPMDLSKGGSTKVKTYKESVEAELEESKTARMMALITALGAAYGLEDDAREFAYKIQQNIDNAQNAEPNPGRPDPVTKGNPLPGADRVMRPPVDEIAPAVAAVGRGVAKGVGAVAKGVGSMAKTAGTKMAINKMKGEIEDDEANEASTTSKILKGAPGAPSGRPKSMREYGAPSADAKKRAGAAQQKNIDDEYVDTVASNSKAGIYRNTSEKAVSKSQQRFFGMVDALKKGEKVKGATADMRKAAKDMSNKDVKDFARTKHKGLPNRVSEAVNVQAIKDEVIGAVRSGNPREMKRVDDTIAKRISDLMDLRGTAGKEVDAEIMTALPVLKKAQMYLRDKSKMTEEKTRIDKKCWKGKKIGNPKTKVKGGVRVNNCVPA